MGSATVANGVVYFGSYDNNVYALDAAGGSELWQYPTGFAGASPPAVVNGVVYVGSDDNNVYAFNDPTASGPGDRTQPTQLRRACPQARPAEIQSEEERFSRFLGELVYWHSTVPCAPVPT